MHIIESVFNSTLKLTGIKGKNLQNLVDLGVSYKDIDNFKIKLLLDNMTIHLLNWQTWQRKSIVYLFVWEDLFWLV